MQYHRYGRASRAKLNTCHPLLAQVAERALELSPYDITIVWGGRTQAEQNALFESGASYARFPDSKHNVLGDDGEMRSEAIDFAPWVASRVPWNDTHVFAVVAGAFFAAAAEIGVSLRWGGDWDGDGSTEDQTLLDWGHIEMIT